MFVHISTHASRIARFLALCTLALAPAFGCGGCKNGGGGNDYEVPDGEFGDILFALCDTIERCPNALGSPIAYRSNNECAAILNFVLTCRLTETEINDVSTWGLKERDPDVDEARAKGCRDFIEEASCNELRGLSEGGPCDGVFSFDEDDDEDDDEQLGALDEPCSYEDECEPHLYCAGGGVDEAAAITYCQVCRPRLENGEDCSGDQCAVGSYCKANGEMTAFVCAPIEEEGVRCYGDDQCKSGWCNQTLDELGGWGRCDAGGNPGDACDQPGACRPDFFCAEDGTCQNRRPNGGACSGTDSNACENYNCDPETKTCGKPEGADCSYDEECADTACIDGTCGGGASGACKGDEHCADGEYCAGACRPPNCDCSGDGCPVGTCTPEGQSGGGAGCQDDDECPSGECDDGVCLEGAQIGDACTQTYECYPYQCSDGACAEKAGPGDECEAIDSCQEPFLCIDGRCEIMNLTCAPAAAGQRCAWLRVCDEDSWCDLFDDVTCKPRASLGEECETSPIRGTETCRSGSTCAYDEASGTSRCIKVGDEGEPCVGGKCTEGTFCWEGTCQAGPLGQPCDEYDDSIPPCESGLYCNEGACVPRGGLDAQCDDPHECADGLYCENYSTCQMVKGQNEECDDSSECRGDLWCSRDTRTCVPRLGEGLSCQNHENSCAEGFFCPSGSSTCTAMRAAGEECYENQECDSGACYSSFCLSQAECVNP